MKKLLGFFAALGIIAASTASPVVGFAENELDFSSPINVLDSISEMLENRVFKDETDFMTFLDGEIFSRHTNLVTDDSSSHKPQDIFVTFDAKSKSNYEFRASFFATNINNVVALDHNSSVLRMINVVFANDNETAAQL